MIGVDWGTSSARAYRLAPGGAVLGRREAAARGILHVAPDGFGEALREMVGDWIAGGDRHVLLAGMVGSRQGWLEAPYLPCPAGLEEIAGALVPVPFADAEVRLVPGLSAEDGARVPEVMRGEEGQVLGALGGGADALVCLPGSHAKWVRVEGGRIAGFETSVTGEAYAALRGHTILGRMMQGEAAPGPAFDAGVARAADPGGLLHHLFGARTLALFGRLGSADGASYLSGLLIGHEVAASLPGDGGCVHLVGAGPLMALYARAITLRSGTASIGDADAAAHGLALIGERAAWL